MANSSDILKLRTELYIAVINSASRNSLDKNEVPRIAEAIWKAISDPKAHSERTPEVQK